MNGVAYQKLSVVGKGGTSQVFQVLSPDGKIRALKRVSLKDEASGRLDRNLLECVSNEVTLMLALRSAGMTGPLGRIIEVVDAQTDTTGKEPEILIVMEHGEIDLAHLLARYQHGARDGALDDNYLRMYWQQMLEAVHAIHEQRVIHGDLKPANFLCVQGCLKLIDFGIAKQHNDETVNIARENAVGTLNYMSPEAIVGAQANAGSSFKVGRPSDVWSLGCILYQMAYGHTPFSHIKGQIQKLFAITNEKHVVDFPPASNPQLLEVMKSCLRRNPAERPSIPELLQHPLLRGGGRAAAVAPSPGKAALADNLTAKLVAQLSSAGAGGAPTKELVESMVREALAGGGATAPLPPAPPPPPPPPPPPSLGSKATSAPSIMSAPGIADALRRQGSQLKKVDASAPKAAPASKLPKAAASLAEQIAARRAHMGGAGDDDGNTGDLSWM